MGHQLQEYPEAQREDRLLWIDAVLQQGATHNVFEDVSLLLALIEDETRVLEYRVEDVQYQYLHAQYQCWVNLGAREAGRH